MVAVDGSVPSVPCFPSLEARGLRLGRQARRLRGTRPIGLAHPAHFSVQVLGLHDLSCRRATLVKSRKQARPGCTERPCFPRDGRRPQSPKNAAVPGTVRATTARPPTGERASDMSEPYMTIEQVADYLNVKTRWLYERSKSMPVHRFGRHLRYRRSELDAWAESLREPQSV